MERYFKNYRMSWSKYVVRNKRQMEFIADTFEDLHVGSKTRRLLKYLRIKLKET